MQYDNLGLSIGQLNVISYVFEDISFEFFEVFCIVFFLVLLKRLCEIINIWLFFLICYYIVF